TCAEFRRQPDPLSRVAAGSAPAAATLPGDRRWVRSVGHQLVAERAAAAGDRAAGAHPQHAGGGADRRRKPAWAGQPAIRRPGGPADEVAGRVGDHLRRCRFRCRGAGGRLPRRLPAEPFVAPRRPSMTPGGTGMVGFSIDTALIATLLVTSVLAA